MTHLSKAIVRIFDFSKHLNGPPILDELAFDDQNELYAAFVEDLRPEHVSAIWDHISESKAFGGAKIIVDFIKPSTPVVDNSLSSGYSVLQADLRCTIETLYSEVINAEIAQDYADYINHHGRFSPDDDSGPGELVGLNSTEQE